MTSELREPVTTVTADASPAPAKPPLYWRLLRLHYVRPNGWQRAILVEGVLGLSFVLVLADVASAWTLLVLPLASAAAVKSHDMLLGLMGTRVAEPLPASKLADRVPWKAAGRRGLSE